MQIQIEKRFIYSQTELWSPGKKIMTKESIVLNSDRKYIDGGNLLRSRSELSVAKILSFFNEGYEYDVDVKMPNGKYVKVDFKTQGNKYIEVIESEEDTTKFKTIREKLPTLDIIAVGNSKYVSRITEIDSLFFFNSGDHLQTGSIFIEDPALAFDYAHILPLVEKCSVLHGHTSTVMVEIIGTMKNNMVFDFGDAKRIIKETLNAIDHKFFINKKYLQREDDLHYYVAFEGPKGYFSLQLPKSTTYMLSGEATVEKLSSEIIKLLAPKMPHNIEALGVYIYEGINKGAHIIAGVNKEDNKK